MLDRQRIWRLCLERFHHRFCCSDVPGGGKALAFDPDLRLSPETFQVLWEKGGLERVFNHRLSTREAVSCFLGNVFHAWDAARRPVEVPLSRLAEWRRWRRYCWGIPSTFPQIVAGLEGIGLVRIRRGFRMSEGCSGYTLAWATRRLYESCEVSSPRVVYCPTELVILKSKDGRLLDYRDTAFTTRLRNILRRVNSVNQSSSILLGPYRVSAYLRAIFIDSFQLYGRLHTKGFLHYQGIPSQDRLRITIDGDPVIELDYSSLHLHLLYATQVGHPPPGGPDPYGAIVSRCSKSLGYERELREVVKKTFMCMINCDSMTKAEKAVSYWLRFRAPSDIVAAVRDAAFPPHEAIRLILQQYKDLSPYFFSSPHNDRALRIMNLDSSIATEVVDHFGRRRKPILAVHDSFLVQEQWQDELREVMHKSFMKKTRSPFPIPIHSSAAA